MRPRLRKPSSNIIPQSQYAVDVRKRLRSIWYQASQLGNEDQMDKAAKYHDWVALPLTKY